MTSKKRTGSYYTPSILSDFLIKHIFSNYIFKSDIKILEPSCGDGEFVFSLFENDSLRKLKSVSIELVDINKDALARAKDVVVGQSIGKVSVKTSESDYLEYRGKDYSLIFGNPPYISQKLLLKRQIKKCREICTSIIPAIGETKNIWPAFLLKAISSLAEDGILCFVLPAELLQVNYTREIRKYLLQQFERIEIFAFNELIFPDIEQDVVALIGVKKVKNEKEKGMSFYQVDKLSDLKIPDYLEKHNNVHRKNLDKWTNYILTDEELNLIEGITERLQLKKIKTICEKVEVGIVTAANDFFIVNEETVKENGLQRYAKLILQKGTQIKNTITITNKFIGGLVDRNKKVYLLNFPEKFKVLLSKKAQRYLMKGQEKDINRRYKMLLRKFWYNVPVIWVSEGMFVKRSHLFPRILINKAKVCVTDSFYRIKMKKEYSISSLTFSFYNTLSFVLAELEGRFYGGGVLELTPNEFKNLYVPYKEISKTKMGCLEKMSKNGKSINSILDYTDDILLSELSVKERTMLRVIWKRLVDRRLKVPGKGKTAQIYRIPEEVLSQVAEPLEYIN